MNDSFLKDKAGADALPVPHRASIDMGSAEFFERARARLNFDVPAALADPSIVAKTGDLKEGVAAFIEKRPATFKGEW